MKSVPSFHVVVVAGPRVSRLSDCLSVIENNSCACAYRLDVVDFSGVLNGSKIPKSLEWILANVSIHRGPSVNRLIFQLCQASESRFMVVVRGDALVPMDWLNRLREVALARPNHVLVTPVSNACSPYRLPLAPGTNPRIFDDLLRKNSSGIHPDADQGLGCCFLIDLVWFRRLVRWDRKSADGDTSGNRPFHQLVVDPYRKVVAEGVFVHHCLSQTDDFEDVWREVLTVWGGAVPRTKKNPIFQPLSPWQKAVKKRGLLIPEGATDLNTNLREMARRSKKAISKRNLRDLFRAMSRGVQGVFRISRLPREIPQGVRQPNRLRVLYLLNDFVVAGGVYSVVQLVNELTLLGVDVVLGYVRKSHEVDRWPLLTRPIRFSSEGDFLLRAPKCDVVVATHWTTAEWVARLRDSGKARLGIYFIQDYEAWFYPERNRKDRERVLHSYTLLPDKIVKSDWLADLLKKDGYESKKIPLGLDLGIFYPRPKVERKRPRIVSLVRPSTPRRGSEFVIDTLAALSANRPEVDLALFGHDYLRQIPFPFQDFGVIGDVYRLPDVFSHADIFFEGSRFQAFGRTALECMACGTACVLTDQGGLHEYASHGKNCLMVSHGDVPAAVDAIEYLIQHPQERQNIISNGLSTAAEFDHKIEARNSLTYFEELLKK